MSTTPTFPTQQQVQQLVDFYLDGAPNVGVVVGVAAPGVSPATSVLYFVGGDLLNQNSEPITFDADTPFWIASLTKTFTTTLFANYAQGSASVWNGTLGEFQPAGSAPLYADYAALTLQSVANYTSGLPEDYEAPVNDQPDPLPYPYTVADMYQFLSTDRFPLGSGYNYSNLGFALLGHSMAQAGGQPDKGYSDLLSSVVLEPLGLWATHLYGQRDLTPIPLGYYADGSQAPLQWAQYPACNPGGGLISTATDMMQWMQYNMGMLDTPMNSLLP